MHPLDVSKSLETPINKGFLSSSKNYEFDDRVTNTVPNLVPRVAGILKKTKSTVNSMNGGLFIFFNRLIIISLKTFAGLFVLDACQVPAVEGGDAVLEFHGVVPA